MENKYFAELARRLRAAGITAGHPEKNRLTVLLNNQPVLSVSAGSDVFLLPAGSNQPEAGELYHKVAQTADEVYAYGYVSYFGVMALEELMSEDPAEAYQAQQGLQWGRIIHGWQQPTSRKSWWLSSSRVSRRVRNCLNMRTIQPHHNRGSLKNRADEIAMELQRILAQKASAGICGRESKESLA